MKRVKSGRKSHRFMGRLLAGMTAAAVFISSFAGKGVCKGNGNRRYVI